MPMPSTFRLCPSDCRRVAALLLAAACLAGTAPPVLARDLPDFVELVEKVGPAVVNIRTVERTGEGAA